MESPGCQRLAFHTLAPGARGQKEGMRHSRRELCVCKSVWASLVTQMVKNPPAMWETWVRCLGWEVPLEKGKGTHSRILVWRILWTV